MPAHVTLYDAMVWFLVGLCVGSGWAVGVWIVGRLLR